MRTMVPWRKARQARCWWFLLVDARRCDQTREACEDCAAVAGPNSSCVRGDKGRLIPADDLPARLARLRLALCRRRVVTRAELVPCSATTRWRVDGLRQALAAPSFQTCHHGVRAGAFLRWIVCFTLGGAWAQW